MKSHRWYEDGDYWSANRSFIWTAKRIEMSGVAAGRAAAMLGMNAGDSVLDLACGFGRHALALSQMGYAVTGVDLNPDFISEATAKASSEGLSARFIRADMREYVSPGSFDHVVILYNSFGYFSDPADDARVLSNCFASLKPGGQLLLHLHPREGRAHAGPGRYWNEDEGGVFYLQEYSANPEETWITVRHIVLNGASRREWEYGVRIYGEEEIRSLLRAAGFASLSSYGSLGGEEYRSGDLSLYLLGRKPAAD